MPRFRATDRRVGYDMVCFDSGGEERRDDPDGLMSDQVLRSLAATDSGITDVFLLCHGWKGDVPAAKEQFDGWLEAMTRCEADFARARQLRPASNHTSSAFTGRVFRGVTNRSPMRLRLTFQATPPARPPTRSHR